MKVKRAAVTERALDDRALWDIECANEQDHLYFKQDMRGSLMHSHSQSNRNYVNISTFARQQRDINPSSIFLSL